MAEAGIRTNRLQRVHLMTRLSPCQRATSFPQLHRTSTPDAAGTRASFIVLPRSLAYAASHGCPSLHSSLLQRMRPWKSAHRVSSAALAKEDTLRRDVTELPTGTTAVKREGSTGRRDLGKANTT